MRRALSLCTVVAVAFPLYAASAAPAAQAKPATSHWVNHDQDDWSGWAGQAPADALTNPQGCDPIDPAQCMLPYPNDWFTSSDPTSATGRRLNLNPLAMPRSVAGVPIVPTAWNTSDGFSAGSEILTVVPGMTQNADLAASRLPTDINLAVNDASNLGVVLFDATTGRRWPVWAEIDHYTNEAGLVPAGTTSPVQQDLMIHPAMNLLDGHRYVVGLRHLETDSGQVAPQSSGFAAYVQDYRNHTNGGDPRSEHMAGVFDDLKEAGWKVSSNPNDLFLAWDFTTASSQNVAGRLLAIRDDAFEQLGMTKAQIDAGKLTGRAPSFTVTSVTNYTPKQNPEIAREIHGTITVPCYITPTCSPPVKCEQIPESPIDDCPSPGQFAYKDPTDPDSEPMQAPGGQTYDAAFTCNVGQTGFRSGRMYRPVEYGHGLFGSRSEVGSSPQREMANRKGMLYCAVNWFGFANADVPNAVLALSNLSVFPILADRTLQGELDFLYLARLMIHPKGFASNAAFKRGGKTFINLHDGVYYDGNSQGGIYGGTVCAVSIDVRHCSLGVLGMDYPLLLPRSVDYVATRSLDQAGVDYLNSVLQDPTSFDPTGVIDYVGYSNILDTFYPEQAQRQLTLDILSTLWDRDDPDGYAGHMTSTAVGGLLRDCTGLGAVPVAKVNKTCPVATPDHHVLLQVAWGDHQVANITAFDEARTIGARAVGLPATSNKIGSGDALLASRRCSHEPHGNRVNDPVDGNYCWKASSVFWNINPIKSYPYDGSAIVIFDGGADSVALPFATDPPPPSDVPQPDTATNHDPHEGPRRACAAQDQKGAFFHVKHGYVTAPKQQFTNGHKPAGPPYFDGNFNGVCSLP
ncbi:MAG TPA: hypothetical protein VHE56_08160 [Mycobacteriales bacterium]|nr:hypothetical protein [Mycobacteriales bacterium]